MALFLTAQAGAHLRSQIDEATSDPQPKLPGVILHVVDNQNHAVFTHASGGTVPLSSQTLNTIHSVTKIIGAIALMQLVDRSLVSLDDPSVIPTLLPELAAKKILTGFTSAKDGTKSPIFVDQEGDITPRMLMNHTYGGGHTYFNTLLYEYLQEGWDKRNEASDPHQTILDSPLLWQPGTHANYGQGFDWVAVLIERATKQNLSTYFQQHIFEPLGLQHIGFEEQYGSDITSRPGHEGLFWPRSMKQPDGTYIPIDPPVLQQLERGKTAYPQGEYHAYPLGSGLVASAEDTARILLILAPQNAGRDPVSGHQLLTPEAVSQITSPQLPAHLRNDSHTLPSAIGVIVPDGRSGRSKGSVYWYGAANTEFWIDGEKGIVVFVNGNHFPMNNEIWFDMVARLEGDLYEGLRA
ncbi:beta-lactamase family protein [Lophiostoma macrostomum CBS 122681]|uniref:Beta-lactamase family protein n=1 Tax=Lophiostoma macrostomum CBS 122681 TaxID=1314788 RepID=A0A6A6SRE5_9PLEO|nr:beta-lactamase family protein [Lophiostoma macrostomum CBS 122681]